MKKVYKVAHLFCGIGGGAIGFQRARSEFRGMNGSFRTLYGVDYDPAACADFERLTGAPAACADIATMTPEALLAAGKGEHPDVIFLSPPCTGFSGLLSEEKSQDEHYQSLNRRKAIGNMVPVGAAQAIAGEMLRTLLSVDAGATFVLGGSGVWVRREREARAEARQ